MFGLFYLEPELEKQLRDMNNRMGRFLDHCAKDKSAQDDVNQNKKTRS